MLSGYISAMALMWTPQNNKKFHYVSIGIWLLLSCCCANQFGSLRIVVFIIMQLILLGGFIYEVHSLQEQINLEGGFIILSVYFLLQKYFLS